MAMFSSKAVFRLLFLGGVFLPYGSTEPVPETDLIITELADPNSNFEARYIELFSATLAGQTIVTPNLFLARWTNGNPAPTPSSAIALTGKTVGSDGFLILCRNDAAFQTAYSTTCDVEGGSGGPADSNGDDQIAIVVGDLEGSFVIVDIFGVPGEDGTGTAHEFEDGRAERRGTFAASSPKAIWNVADWNVFSDAPGSAIKEVVDMDPREWIGVGGDLIITEIADPNSNDSARFVELYSPKFAGATISAPNLYLARWTNGNPTPTSSTAVALTGQVIGSDGFLLICRDETSFQIAYSTTCDVEAGSGGPADSNGDDQIAIVQGDPAAIFVIVDIFGVPGEDGTGTSHEFEDGRAERKGTAAASSPKAIWDAVDWNVFSDAPGSEIKEVSDMDPREWIGIVASTEPPTESLAPSTSMVPSESPTPIPKVSIQDIQGDSDASPLVGVRVRVELAYVTRVVYNGFFMQQEPQDGVIASSGIFVFTFDEPSDLEEGYAVQVEGTVEERFGQTQLGDFAAVSRLAEEDDVKFHPVKVVLPLANVADFEDYEGMLVDVEGQEDHEIYISEYFNFDRFGEILVCAAPEEDGRIFQYTARNPPSVAGYIDHIDKIARSCLKIDDNNGSQNPNPAKLGGIYPIVDTFTNHFRGGAEIKKLIGPLWFSFGDWRVATLTEDDLDWDNKPNERLEAPEVKGADTTIGVANVLNYFVTLDERGADTEAEFERQGHKVVMALTDISADIFALVEVENSPDNGAMSNLVTRLNIATGRQYASASDGPIGGDAIRVGVVYDTEEYDLMETATLDDSNPSLADLILESESGGIFNSNRVPLAATLRHKKDGATLRVVVNHFKSKGDFSGTASGLDADMGDGAGNFNNQRSLAARALLLWTEQLQLSEPTDYELLLGDFNAYEREDPIEIIKAGGFTSLVGLEEGDEPLYGYVFDGQFGFLDYAFIRDAAECNAAAVEWRGINSDEPDIYDYNLDFDRNAKIYDATTPIRYSDHDPIVIGLNFEGEDCDKPIVKEGKKMTSGRRRRGCRL